MGGPIDPQPDSHNEPTSRYEGCSSSRSSAAPLMITPGNSWLRYWASGRPRRPSRQARRRNRIANADHPCHGGVHPAAGPDLLHLRVFADRLSKRTVIITMKAVETLLMAGATLALFSHPTGGYWALAVLAGMGFTAPSSARPSTAFFPNCFPTNSSRACSLLELFTFLAILTGTTAGGFLLAGAGSQAWLAPRPHPPRPGRLRGSLDRSAGSSRACRRRPVRHPAGRVLCVAGRPIARLAITGRCFLDHREPRRSKRAGVRQSGTGPLGCVGNRPLGALISVGIGVGALVVSRLSRSHVEYGLVPLGAAESRPSC